MMPRKFFITLLILGMAVFSLPTRADVVVLKTGKKFNVEKVWRENDQIWIMYHGMRARISPSKVARIESTSNRDAAKLDLKKEESPNIKRLPRSTPRDASGRQAKIASQTAPPPQPAKIKKDRDRIFPEDNFGELKWGTKIYAIKGLEKIQDAEGQDGIVEYRRQNENLKFGQAALSSIHYAFWRDQLYMLTIRTRGGSNYTALRREVFRQFGIGLRTDPAFERYLWTEAPNDMMLQYSKDGEQGLLWLRSGEIDRQYKLSQISGPAYYLRWMKSRN
jgi:hypothetical protein